MKTEALVIFIPSNSVALYRALRDHHMVCSMKYVSDDPMLIKGLANELKGVSNPFQGKSDRKELSSSQNNFSHTSPVSYRSFNNIMHMTFSGLNLFL